MRFNLTGGADRDQRGCSVDCGLVIFHEIPIGLSEAAASLIGNSIGANNVNLGKRFLKITAIFSLGAVTCIAMCIGLARHQIVAIFGLTGEVAHLASQLLIVIAIGFFFDGM